MHSLYLGIIPPIPVKWGKLVEAERNKIYRSGTKSFRKILMLRALWGHDILRAHAYLLNFLAKCVTFKPALAEKL